MATFLSPKKYHLICELGSLVSPAVLQHDNGIPHFDQETGLLLWSCVTMNGVSADTGMSTTEALFEDWVVSLAPYCHAVHEWVLCLEDKDVRNRYEKYLEWTGNVQLFLDRFKMARSNQGVEASLSIMLSTAALERALGDVFLLKSKEPCPAMLKNLLATQELTETLGENAITLLRILIGPPTSLNLRNVLWHGFAAPDEIPQRYSTFLLIVAASLGCLLTDRGIAPGSIPHRKPLVLPQLETEPFVQRFPEINSDDLDILWRLFSTTTFFHKPMLPYCKAALDFFKEEKYGVSVVLLLPQLENGLRRLFASANDCQERILTAETEYFTTFDEMLCPNLSDETVNALAQVIGESYMNMLLDLLVHPEGPRLRDHISHGELDLQTISRASAVHVMSVCAAFCLRDYQDASVVDVPLLRTIRTTADDYTPLFHPISLLKQEVMTFLESLSQWVGLSRPNEEEFRYQTWSNSESESNGVRDTARYLVIMNHGIPIADEDFFQSMVIPFADLDPLLKCVSDSLAKTLFRPRKEMEVTSLLRRITAQCLVSSNNVKEMTELRYQQYLAKELRSRQRANYTRLLNCIPRLSSGLRLVALLLLCQFRSLHSVSSLPPKNIEALIKFLKSILRFAENLNSLTSPEKNKWDESCNLTDSLQQQVQTYCAKLEKTQLDQ